MDWLIKVLGAVPSETHNKALQTIADYIDASEVAEEKLLRLTEEADRLGDRLAQAEEPFAARLAQLHDALRLDPERRPLEGGPMNYWSTARIGGHVSGTDHRLFASCLGQGGQGFQQPLDLTRTNVREGGLLAAFAYAIEAIGVELACDDSATRGALREHAVLRMDLVQTRIAIGPLSTLSPWGLPMPWNVRLEQGTWGSVVLNIGRDCPPLNHPVDVRVVLYGRHPKSQEPEPVPNDVWGSGLDPGAAPRLAPAPALERIADALEKIATSKENE